MANARCFWLYEIDCEVAKSINISKSLQTMMRYAVSSRGSFINDIQYNTHLRVDIWSIFNLFKHSIQADDEVGAVGDKANPNKADQS
jgi:hypothetical protein